MISCKEFFEKLILKNTSTLKKNLSGIFHIRGSNSLDPDQDRQHVGPDLDPNCLQMLSAEVDH